MNDYMKIAKAVSYTHLDVYKRQIMNNTSLTVVSTSRIARFFRRIKEILSASVELKK